MKLYFAIFGASILAAAACGARTGLPVPNPPEVDAGPDVEDAPSDAPPDVVDAPPDVVDAPPDVPVVNDCEDAGTTFIYVITAQNVLYSFYPPNNGFLPIGTIACPSTAFPYSMAVDRKGTAYVVFSDPDDSLYEVSTLNASCKTTTYQPTQFGAGRTFGMGFSANTTDPGETLFVASDDPSTSPTVGELLGTIDVTSLQLATVGQFPHPVGSAELTGTGDGRLFGFGVSNNANAAVPPVLRLVEIDKANPQTLLSETFLTLPAAQVSITDWAFAFWGGNFYFFTATDPAGPSTVSLYQPGGPPVAMPILTLEGNAIVGAGVSTCAPQQ